MKVDRRFHCFGCGADGDVIDFTAKLYQLSVKEAAEKLAQDFSIPYDNKSRASPPRNAVRQKSEAEKYKEAEGRCFRVYSDYFHQLNRWEKEFAPKLRTQTGIRFLWKLCKGNRISSICLILYYMERLQTGLL